MFKPGILLKGVLIPKEDNKPDPSFFEMNLDFLFPQTEHKDFICNLPSFVLKTLASLFSVFFTTYTISLHVSFLYLIWLKCLKK